uniref:Uncharacterized protein n=1 Tax=Anguilla anguilla TaxID=7936 RepID=A0A0E9VFJ4_ANGAN
MGRNGQAESTQTDYWQKGTHRQNLNSHKDNKTGERKAQSNQSRGE